MHPTCSITEFTYTHNEAVLHEKSFVLPPIFSFHIIIIEKQSNEMDHYLEWNVNFSIGFNIVANIWDNVCAQLNKIYNKGLLKSININIYVESVKSLYYSNLHCAIHEKIRSLLLHQWLGEDSFSLLQDRSVCLRCSLWNMKVCGTNGIENWKNTRTPD